MRRQKASWLILLLILCLSPAVRALSPLNQYFNLVAGEGDEGFRDGPFAGALFNHPSDAVVSEDGSQLFVADRDNHRIRCVQLTDRNNVSTLAGTGQVGHKDGPADKATFEAPFRLALLSGRRLVIYDNGTSSFRLLRLDDHQVTTLLSADKALGLAIGPAKVYGMVADPDGHHLYFTQPDAQALRRLDVDTGLCETVFEKDARLPNPAALCLFKGKLCVADRDLPALYQVEPHAAAPNTTPPVLGAELTQVAQGDHVVALTESDGVLYAFQAADIPWVRLTSTDNIPAGEVKFMSVWAPYLEPKSQALLGLMDFHNTAMAPILAAWPGKPREFLWVSPRHQQLFSLKDYQFYQYKETKKEVYTPTPDSLTDYAYPEKKGPGCYRILMLGDSRVFYEDEFDHRWPWNGFNRQETLPKKLEFALNMEAALRDAPLHFEVLTFGQYRWEGPLYWWPSYRVPALIKKYDVDCVMMLMPNDLDLDWWFSRPITKEGIPQEAADSEFALKPIQQRLADQPFLRKLYDRCVSKNWIKKGKSNFPEWGALSTDGPVKDQATEMVRRPLARFMGGLKALEGPLGHPVPFHMLFVPLGSAGSPYNPIEPYRDLYRDICGKTGIGWVDLTEPWTALKVSGFPTSEFFYMYHFDYNGHTLLTYLLTHVLIERHLVPLDGQIKGLQ